MSAILASALALAGCATKAVEQGGANARWVTAWATAPLAEIPGKETPPLEDATLRQIVRVAAGGSAIRIRLGNYFGREPLLVAAGAVAPARAGAAELIDPLPLRFGARESVTVAPGDAITSDPIPLAVRPGDHLTIGLHLAALPETLTGHSAARANSYVTPGNTLDQPSVAPAQTFTRWYFLMAVDVLNAEVSAVAVLGDSITDGYGIPPDSYRRWPDLLNERLQANPATRDIAVLNLGIGGNRLLRDGLGPRALDRVQRDIFGQHGVTTMVVMLGINDIGTRLDARKKGQPYATAGEIVAALRTLAEQARERGLRVIGATITPYRGADFYWSADGEADRQTVNDWIRTTDVFDAVIDFDAALRDPERPDRLAAAFDSGDHLHPSVAGYAEMARAVDLTLLARSRR